VFTFGGTHAEYIQFLSTFILAHKPGINRADAAIEAERIYACGRHKDIESLAYFRNEVLALIGSKIGMYCMSTRPDDILMWSHYSDDHKGYCLEFEASDDTPFFGEAQPVIYSDSYPTVDFFQTPSHEQLELIFLTKASHWRYENEWRIIDHTAGPGMREYPEGLMTGVIFGVRLSECHKSDIRKWLAQRNHNVQTYQAVRQDGNFKIEIQLCDA
jgi:hypothetical protein